MNTAGCLFSMVEYMGTFENNDDFPGQAAAFASDAVGTIIGALLGTSTVTTYIESGAGINEGGRTGLTAIIVGLFFFSSLLFSPIWASIPPWATGPALIAIGSMMVKTVRKIDWEDMRIAIPAFVTMILMPLTYSIANGIIGGLMVHCFIKICDYIIDKLENIPFLVSCCSILAGGDNNSNGGKRGGSKHNSAEGAATVIVEGGKNTNNNNDNNDNSSNVNNNGVPETKRLESHSVAAQAPLKSKSDLEMTEE